MVRRRNRDVNNPKVITLKIRYNKETEDKLEYIIEKQNLSKAEFLRRCIDREYEQIK